MRLLGAEENGTETGKDLAAVAEDHQDCVVEVVAVITKRMLKKEKAILSTDPVEEAPAVDHVLPTVREEKHLEVEVAPVVVEEVTTYFLFYFFYISVDLYLIHVMSYYLTFQAVGKHT